MMGRMPSLSTTYFGELDYDLDSVFEFPPGIPGFEQHCRFLLVEQAQSRPLVFVQSLLSPDLCFIAVPVLVLDPQYRLELSEEDLVSLQFPGSAQPQIGEDVACLALVTVTEGAPPSANMRSPLVLNLKKRVGHQIIQPDPGYSFRQSIQSSEEADPCSC